MGIKSIILAVTSLTLSTSVNAVVLNTLSGVDYEWLELTETAGLSRNAVELRLADVNDNLYGYEYASRHLVEDLFLSYSTWDGLDGWHSDSGVISGSVALLTDFGTLQVTTGNGIDSQVGTVDGSPAWFDFAQLSRGFYGLADECGGGFIATCRAEIAILTNAAGINTAAMQDGRTGWSSTVDPSFTDQRNLVDSRYGSFLVRSTVVPVPAAAWLFGSGLLGLIGVARRKKS